MSDINLDELLTYLGHFGPFQKRNYFLICLLVVFSVFPMSYIFTTRDLKYRQGIKEFRINVEIFIFCRCFVKECDGDADAIYKTEWVKYAIPHDNNVPRRCERFGLSNDVDDVQTCVADSFNRTKVIPCYQFVYDDPDITVGREVSITLLRRRVYILKQIQDNFKLGLCVCYFDCTAHSLRIMS